MDEMEIVRKKKSNVNKGYLQNVVRSNSSLLSYADKATEVKKRAYQNARNNYVTQVGDKLSKNKDLRASLQDLMRIVNGDTSIAQKYGLVSEDTYNQKYGLGKYRETAMRDMSAGMSVNDSHTGTYRDYVIQGVAEKALNGKGLDGVPRGILIDAITKYIDGDTGRTVGQLIPHAGYDRFDNNIRNLTGSGFEGYKYSEDEIRWGNKFGVGKAFNSAVDLFGTPVRLLGTPIAAVGHGITGNPKGAVSVLGGGNANVIPTAKDNFTDDMSNTITGILVSRYAANNPALKFADKSDNLISDGYKKIGEGIVRKVGGNEAVNNLKLLDYTGIIKNPILKKAVGKAVDKATGGVNANSVTKNIGNFANNEAVKMYDNVLDVYRNPRGFAMRHLPRIFFETPPTDDVIMFPRFNNFNPELKYNEKENVVEKNLEIRKNKS